MRQQDRDIVQEYDEAYRYAMGYWEPFLVEAETDTKKYLGDQWDPALYNYLKWQRRDAYVVNLMQRVVHMVSGYQRKNRLSIKVDPVEGSDERTASQMSGVLQYIMSRGDGQVDGYSVMSDAFQFGPLVSGLNFVHPYLDRTKDPANGDIAFARVPYNRLVIDPGTQDRGLRSCGFMMRRELVHRNLAKVMLPWAHREIDHLRVSGSDGKYTKFIPPPRVASQGDRLKYDEYWIKTTKPVRALVDPGNAELRILPERINREALATYMAYSPRARLVDLQRQVVELRVIVEGEVMYQGPDPGGLDDEYPLVACWGLWVPEYHDTRYNLQGLIRVMRDPQDEGNKRWSKISDIMDSQISSGWKAKAKAVINKQDLYKSGQGVVVWVDDNADMRDAEKIQMSAIPAGLFQMIAELKDSAMDVVGVNSELFGQQESGDPQMSGVLAKLRQGAGLTVLQNCFDSHRFSKKQLGNKILKMVQRNYSAAKVKRIIGEDPTPEFAARSFGRYDASVGEGVLTDTQRQMYYAQLMGARAAGAPIPWSAIIEAAPIESKHKLLGRIKQEEQAQAQAGQLQQKLQMLQIALMQAQLANEISHGKERSARARSLDAGANLDRVKAAAEAAGITGAELDRSIQLARAINDLAPPPERSAPAAGEVPAMPASAAVAQPQQGGAGIEEIFSQIAGPGAGPQPAEGAMQQL